MRINAIVLAGTSDRLKEAGSPGQREIARETALARQLRGLSQPCRPRFLLRKWICSGRIV